jgi:single-stranded-DNA-specific exonuclease
VAYKLVSALRFASRSELYGQDICLLDARPANEAYVIEAVKIRNLVVVNRISETVVPGMVEIEKTRLVPFLQGQQIFVWDAPLQKRTLAKVFGAGVEVNMLDISAEIAKVIPSVTGKSLLRIKELSRIARYAEKSPGELDVFINLFISFARKKEEVSGKPTPRTCNSRAWVPWPTSCRCRTRTASSCARGSRPCRPGPARA